MTGDGTKGGAYVRSIQVHVLNTIYLGRYEREAYVGIHDDERKVKWCRR